MATLPYVTDGYTVAGYIGEGIYVDWPTKEIFVPQSYLTLISGDDYELDVNQFRLDLRAEEATVEGMNWPKTHKHNTAVDLGGVTYARIVEIINGYTVTFENSLYTVSLLGANNNVLDVTNLNQVSVRSNNSAGLIDAGQVNVDLTTVMQALYIINEGVKKASILVPHTGTVGIDDPSTIPDIYVLETETPDPQSNLVWESGEF